MAIGLEPCPFCGSAAVTIFGADRKWNASCCNCGASSVMCGSHEEAFDAWNRRVVDNDELRYLVMEIEDADVDDDFDWGERIREAVGL